MSTAAHKGDVVAVEMTHSSTAANFKTTTYTDWHLAHVVEASRAGIVRKVQLLGQAHATEVSHRCKVYAISGDNQPKARAIADAMTYPATVYATAEELKAAILEA